MDWEALLASLNPMGSAQAAGLGGDLSGGPALRSAPAFPDIPPTVPLDQAPPGAVPPIQPPGMMPPRIAQSPPPTATEPSPLGASLQGPPVPYLSGAGLGPGLPNAGATPVAAPPAPAAGAPATSGAPMSLAPPNPGGVPPQAAALQAAARGNDPRAQLLAALRGVTAPKPPEVQKVSTPSLPAARAVAAPKLLEILGAMGLGRAPNPVSRMPMTLGQALSGR